MFSIRIWRFDGNKTFYESYSSGLLPRWQSNAICTDCKDYAIFNYTVVILCLYWMSSKSLTSVPKKMFWGVILLYWSMGELIDFKWWHLKHSSDLINSIQLHNSIIQADYITGKLWNQDMSLITAQYDRCWTNGFRNISLKIVSAHLFECKMCHVLTGGFLLGQ